MKKLNLISTLVMVGLLVFTVNLSQAHCGACGHDAGKQQAQGHKGDAALPCGCAMSEKAMTMHQQMNLVQMAGHAGQFSTLLQALEAADLTEILQGDGPYTVFAPSDAAFAALPESELQMLLQDKDKLRSILTYHVSPGMKTSDQVVKLSSLETVNGQNAPVAVKSSQVMIDQATVTSTDILCSNGVIHIIDKVILPGKMAS